MGISKQILMEQQEARLAAEEILIETGYLKQCPYHEIAYGETYDSNALIRAYQILNAGVTSGTIGLPWGYTRRDYTDLIKEVSTSAPDECPRCAKW